MIKRLLVDTGVWYALFSRRDAHRWHANSMAIKLADAETLVLPWPALYETLRSRFVKESHALAEFMEYVDEANVDFLDSRPYDERVLAVTYDWALEKGRPLSMVDCLLRLVIEDECAAIDALATFNHRDFYDVCAAHDVLLL
ncbi:MAG TPA: PIN domain-containing protein [Pararobbsia sp.]|jgi:predicted nucleic acid-binding protein|nr:PIN domain-containing protein [Pararobbsia sp.]